jgi:phosphoglycolate phosphatase-like HAD superfamily hydrolase
LPTFLFDFDGTLADSLSTIVDITNRLAPEFGYRPTPLKQVDALKGLSTRQLIRYSGISVLKIPTLLRRLRAELIDYSTHITPFQGIPEVVQHLHSQHHPLAIVTSNTPEVVNPFLATHTLDRCFVSVLGGGTLFGKGRLLAKCVARYGFIPEQTVYVGDEVRDIQAARFAGLRSVAVTWGFNSRDVLATAEPDWLIDDPGELSAIATTLSSPEGYGV